MPYFTSTLSGADELAMEHERARFILQHGVYDLRFCGGRDGVPLWHLVTIAEQPHDVQYSILAAGVKAPQSQPQAEPEPVLISAAEVIDNAAKYSREERARIRAAMDAADRAEQKPSGVLFPDVAKEIEFTEKRMEPTEEEFVEFFNVYPRKTDRKRAQKAFAKAFRSLRAKHSPEEAIGIMMRGAAIYAKRVNPEAICHASTWLNCARWEDDPEGIGLKTARQRSSEYGEYREMTPEEYAVF